MSVDKFTVKRGYWIRGEEGSVLLEGLTKRRCCMGFLAQACGITDDDMEERAYFCMLDPQIWDKLPSFLTPRYSRDAVSNVPNMPISYDSKGRETLDSEMASQIYRINDTDELENGEREEALIVAFRRAGVEVEFID